MALLWLAAPAHAKDTPKLPAISAPYGKICIKRDGRPGQVSQTVPFDPVFDVDNRGEIKRWEKIRGKRQR
jgi:hypothetical protein